MQISKTNNVIFLRDVESNIIQEAFVILKDNVKFEIQEKNKSNSKKPKNEDYILREAESLINNEMNYSNIFCVIALISCIIIK